MVKGVYSGGFDCREDVENNFEVKLGDDIHILYAEYDNSDYSGSAFVVFMQNGKLFEVNGSHCSCYGLEGQWDPEATTWASLKYTMDNGRKFDHTDPEFKALVLRSVVHSVMDSQAKLFEK